MSLMTFFQNDLTFAREFSVNRVRCSFTFSKLTVSRLDLHSHVLKLKINV